MKTIFFTVIVVVFIICPAAIKAQTDHRQSRGNENTGLLVRDHLLQVTDRKGTDKVQNFYEFLLPEKY
jgi:hypothetical protein